MTRRHSRYRNVFLLLLALVGCAVIFRPASLFAAFPNYLLSDAELFNGQDMTEDGIRDFLRAKGGGIAEATLATPNGEADAAEIISESASYWNISARYLLTLLQKEQSLITTENPTQRQYDWATGFGVCDDCSKSDPAIQKYKGFYNQVHWAARRIRETYLPLLENTGKIYTFGPGIETIVDGTTVRPTNRATAILYQYTPHLHGNQSFLSIWNRWFLRLFPDGTLIRRENSDTYYLVDGGKKRKFRSLTVVLSSYDPKKAILVSPNDLEAYEDGDPIVFGNYSLIRSPRGTVFLIVDGTKRGVASREVFRTLGFNPEEVQKAQWDDIDLYPDGAPITLESAYPGGALLRNASNGGIVYMEDGVRHALYGKEILKSRFKNRPVTKVSAEELEEYPVGTPVLFQDGELVTSTTDRSIYIISHGEKRPIASRDVFDRLGFKWRNIVVTSPRILDLHPTGEPVTAESNETS